MGYGAPHSSVLVLLLFFCSGATALIYEVLWSKYLSLLLGSTVQAQTVVLAVFMGGLALGNRLFGNRSDLLKMPLAVYGYLELAIGLCGFLFPQLYQIGDWAYIKLGTPIFEWPIFLLLTKLLISTALLLPPTILMGGTLPLLAAWIQRQPEYEAASRVGLFYAVNSLGAVAGAALAGLFLVREYGIVFSLDAAALVNLLVAAAAILLSTREASFVRSVRTEPTALKPSSGSLGWPAMLVAVTGGTSMGLEVLASRSLILVVGGSLQAFALVLMAFILGIGLGSVFISSWRFVKGREHGFLYILLLGAGTLVSVYVIYIEQWIVIYSQARSGLASNAAGYIWHQLLISGLAICLLGVPAALLGAVVPLAIRTVAETPSLIGQKVGRLLTWNTIGAVVGVLLTGFVLMPLFGLRGAFAILSIGLIFLAGAIAAVRRERIPLAIAACLTIALLIGINSKGEDWRVVMRSGAFRLQSVALSSRSLETLKKSVDLLFYKDAPDATVSVERTKRRATNELVLRINGKPDASTTGDLATQFLMGHLPLIMRPGAKDVFVLGFGSGITAGAALTHPIDRLVIAENCRPVLEAGPLFGEFNRNVLTHKKTVVRNEDGRAALKLSRQLYDVIISEPSNPWMAGVATVFSRDYYQIAASRLKPGGLMAQWFHTYEMNDEVVFLVLRTFCSVFPYVELWEPQARDLLLIGSMQPWESNQAVFERAFENPATRQDLAKLGIVSGAGIWARQIACQSTAFAIAGDGPIESDELPILEYAAPRAFFVGKTSEALFNFDERTKQFPLAPAAKVSTLRSVPDDLLLSFFSGFSTANPELTRWLQGGSPFQPAEPLAPIVFRPPGTYPTNVTATTKMVPLFAELLRLETLFLSRPDDWSAHCDAVEAILEKLVRENQLKPEQFRPAYYAAVSARYAIGHQDLTRAVKLLKLGLTFQNDDQQLLFLSRLLDRILPPAKP